MNEKLKMLFKELKINTMLYAKVHNGYIESWNEIYADEMNKIHNEIEELQLKIVEVAKEAL